MERQIALTDEYIRQKREEFNTDEIIKYLIEQMKRIMELSKPAVLVNIKTFEIEHKIYLDEEKLNYWKDQLDRYIKFQYKDLISKENGETN